MSKREANTEKIRQKHDLLMSLGGAIHEAKNTYRYGNITVHDVAVLTARTRRGMTHREKLEELRRCGINPNDEGAIAFLVAEGAISPMRKSLRKRLEDLWRKS